MHELDVRETEKLVESYEQADRFVMKNYLSDLSSFDVVPLPDEVEKLPVSETTRLYKIEKLVYDKRENTLDKLTSVYHALAGNKGSLILIINSDGKETDFYIGTKAEPVPGVVAACQKTLEKAFVGNFPGSELFNLKNSQIEAIIEDIFASDFDYSLNTVASVSGVASLRNDKENFVQGIEKLSDAMRGDRFTAVFIADPVSQHQLNEMRVGYENLYTQLSPFAKSDLQFSANESKAVTESISKGLSESVNQSLTRTQSHTDTYTTTSNTSINHGRNILASAWVNIFGGKTGTSESTSRTSGNTRSDSEGETTGTTRTDSTQTSNASTLTEGNARSLQISFENKSVASLMEKIEEQLQRLKQCEDLGMWNSAAYFIAENAQTAKIAANTYKALMRGTNSSVESACVNTWDNSDKRKLGRVSDYIKKLHHPVINLNQNRKTEIPYVTPGSLVSGLELAIQAGLPHKSISGLPVMESAQFGRNVISYDKIPETGTFRLGHIFHMGKKEDTAVQIDVESLSMHAFITGSTGSGKSNTMYQILDQLRMQGIPFLVVEPAKGEYKHVFGGRKDVQVFGTNPKLAKLLQINPFRFPEGVHVLEHIDRLIEIFNACWPMYAAMPAVLKEAVERVYLEAGWDLEESVTYHEEERFPTFTDLLNVLPEVIRQSEYSQEVKSNYTGALVTRVRSLTNGINGRIFAEQEIDNRQLFDGNCIIDLSRVGSMETKALIMGVLVMRLQEHRMVFSTEMNSRLKHVTVLEEAHNLLRRTSTDQSQEGANLQGKAVEMLAGAIAEMRTYGEGFLIADQSPNLLDLSVIRNTNTKIILRLPDEADRLLVGKASNLNDEQITDIAKLKVGVAAVYQNNWLQPVLCTVEKFERLSPYHFIPMEKTPKQISRSTLGKLVKLLLSARSPEHRAIDREEVDIDKLQQWLIGQKDIQASVKETIVNNLQQFKETGVMDLWEQDQFESLARSVYGLYGGKRILSAAVSTLDFDQWNETIINLVRLASELERDQHLELAVIQCLLREQSAIQVEVKEFYFAWVEHATGRGIV